MLEACSAAWASHFRARDGELRAREGDGDAAYTHATYDLDDERKVRLRRDRRRALESAVRAMREHPSLRDRLLERAAREVPNRRDLLDAAEALDREIRIAERTLRRFSAVPEDHDPSCRCIDGAIRSLPRFLIEQVQALPLA